MELYWQQSEINYKVNMVVLVLIHISFINVSKQENEESKGTSSLIKLRVIVCLELKFQQLIM